MTRPDRSDDDKLDQEFIDKAAAARAHADPEKAARYEASLARSREQRALKRQQESLRPS
jgi:ATPase subunit of ABC transporter with duplicated ATPase domains